MNGAFGRRLRQLRTQYQLLQSTFAETCGISSAYLSDIERGKRFPPRDQVIVKWAGLLDRANAGEIAAELIGLSAQDLGRAEAVGETEIEETGIQWKGGKAPSGPRSADSPTPFIDYFCSDMVEKAGQNALDPAPGYESTYSEIAAIMGRRMRPSALIRAANGGEIRRIIAGLACAMAGGQVPGVLAGKRLLDLYGIQAGVKYRGQFEERLKTLIDELEKVGDGVLVSPNVRELVDFEEGAKGTFFRSALEEGRIRVLAAATPGDWAYATEKNEELIACFQTVEVGPLRREGVLQGLKVVSQRYGEYHGVKYTDEGLVALVDAAEKGCEDDFNQRAFDLLDDMGARMALEGEGGNVGVEEVDRLLGQE